MTKTLSTSRHQERTELTRARFLQSAEKIFALHGFEAAKLEEIAADAGYTRGAFYANFESKEDLFFALLEREVTARIQIALKQIEKFSDPMDRLHALREYFQQKCTDRRWSLLALEFKLFAIRHPEVRARLAALNRRLVLSGVGVLETLVAAAGRKLPASPQAVLLSLGAVTSSLALEYMVDRTVMSEQAVRTITGDLFDCLLGLTA